MSCLVFLVWSYSTQRNLDRIIKLQKECVRIITYSEFTKHTGLFFPELKLLKVKDIFSLSKLFFMLDFINENVPEELETIFVISRFIHSYELAPMVWYSTYHKLKRHVTLMYLTLRYNCANLWNKFYHAFLYKEPNLTKVKLYFKCISWTLVLSHSSSHFRLFVFFFQFYCSQNKII